jgi:hypothetical protein
MGGWSVLAQVLTCRSWHDTSCHSHELYLVGHCQVFTHLFWLTVSFIFNFMIKRRWSGWWTKYNYVLVRFSRNFLTLVCGIGYRTCNRDPLHLFRPIIHRGLADLRFSHTTR